jgi:hypothetical protein
MMLKRFLQLASKRERAEVAVVCNDSVSYLYQLAGQHRYASALLATRIEAATREVAEHSGGCSEPCRGKGWSGIRRSSRVWSIRA